MTEQIRQHGFSAIVCNMNEKEFISQEGYVPENTQKGNSEPIQQFVKPIQQNQGGKEYWKLKLKINGKQTELLFNPQSPVRAFSEMSLLNWHLNPLMKLTKNTTLNSKLDKNVMEGNRNWEIRKERKFRAEKTFKT